MTERLKTTVPIGESDLGTGARVAKNSVALFVVALITKGAGLIVAVIVARYLGPAALGTYAAVMGLGLLLEEIAPLGQLFVIIREVTRDRSRLLSYWLNTSLVTLVFSLMLSITLVAIVHSISYETDVLRSTYLVALYLPIAGLYAITRAVVQGLEQMEHITISAFIGRTLGLLILLILLLAGTGIEAAFIGYGVFLLVAWIILLRVILRLAGQTSTNWLVQLDFGLWWVTLKSSYPFAIQTLLMRSLLVVNVLVLPLMVALETVGIFDAADRVRQTSAIIIPIITVSILPTLSRTFAADREKAIALLEMSFKLLQVVILPFVFFVAIAADHIVLLLYGAGYEAAVPLLRVVIWAQIFFVADSVLNQIMIASDNEASMVRRTALSLGVNVVLVLVLVPLYGVLAAAWAVVITRILNLILDAHYVVRHITPINLTETLGRPLLSAVLSGGLALATLSQGIWVSLVLFIFSYILLLWVIKVFTLKELYMVRQITTQLWQRVVALRKQQGH